MRAYEPKCIQGAMRGNRSQLATVQSSTFEDNTSQLSKTQLGLSPWVVPPSQYRHIMDDPSPVFKHSGKRERFQDVVDRLIANLRLRHHNMYLEQSMQLQERSLSPPRYQRAGSKEAEIRSAYNHHKEVLRVYASEGKRYFKPSKATVNLSPVKQVAHF